MVEGYITNDKITINLRIAMLDAKEKFVLSFTITSTSFNMKLNGNLGLKKCHLTNHNFMKGLVEFHEYYPQLY